MSDINKFTTKEVLNKVLLDSSGNAVEAFSHTTQEALNAALDTTNNRLNVSLNGGTISGDVTIEGDLTVNGNGTGSYDEIVNGDLHVKSDAGNSTSAFLVEQNDGTDVFIVDTTNSRVGIGVTPTVALDISGSTNLSSRIRTTKSGTGKILQMGADRDTSTAPYIGSESEHAFDIITNNTNRMRIDSSGNVVIGQTTAQQKFEVHGGGIRIAGNIASPSSGVTGALIDYFGSDTRFWSRGADASTVGSFKFIGLENDGGNQSTQLEIDSSGNATFAGDITSDGNLKLRSGSGRNIYFTEADGTVDEMSIGYDQANQRLRFRSNAHSVDRMLITKDGNVGIGTTSPSSYNSLANNLVVYENSNSGITIGSSTTGTGSIFFADGTTGDEAYKGRIEYNHGQNKLQFGANSVIHTTLDASGNFGIGSSSPDKTLVVQASGAEVVISDTGTIPTLRFREGGATKGVVRTSGGTMQLYSGGSSASNIKLVLDDNSRISLSNNDSGSSNTLFGFQAGNAIADAGNTGNVLIGHNAGKIANNANFQYNVAMGYATLQSVGSRNLQNVVAIGANTMRSCDSGAPDGTVAIGSSSLYSLTSGEKNVAIGYESMLYQTDGANNTVLGYKALRNADNGESDNVVIGKEAGININHASADANVIIGSNAGFGGNGPISGAVVIGANAMNSTGANNITGAVAVGYNSLTALTSGINNTAIGYTSLESVTTGSGNTALGMGSGDSITDGHDNVIIGVGAGNATTTVGNATIVGRKACQGVMTASSDGAVAVGYEALKSLTSGAGSVGIGYRAGDAITSGDFNTAIGYGALALETTGDRNTAVGYNSLQSANGTNNASNTAVGFESGNLISSGFHNVTIGAKAGNVITTGDYNVIIGGESDPSGNNGQNQIVVGYGATGVADNSVTLGNADVTDVYMAQDSGATVHSSALEMSSFKITQKTFVFASGSTHDIGTADANFCGKIKMYTNHNSGAGYIEYSLVYSTNAKALSLINQNQPYFASVVTLTLNSSTGTVSTSSLSYGQGVTVVVESLNEANASFTFA